TPGYTLGKGQRLVQYPDTKDWVTLAPDAGRGKPSGSRAGTTPVMMERVESWVTLRSSARRVTVYPLDGAGKRLEALPAQDVERTGGSFRIHLQAAGQAFAPWYEVLGE